MVLKEYENIETRKDYINWYTKNLSRVENKRANYYVEKAKFLVEYISEPHLEEELEENIEDLDLPEERNKSAREEARRELKGLGLI